MLTSTVHGGCYYPNGTDRNIGLPGQYFQPIDPFASNSMCCQFGDNIPDTTNAEFPGLCISTAADGLLLREACTDPSWQSPYCIKLCVQGEDDWGSGLDASANDAPVTPCGDGSFCCGEQGSSSKNCCGAGHGVWVVNGSTTSVHPSSTTTSSTSVSFTVSTEPSIVSTSEPAGNKHIGKGVIAGIIVGAVLGTGFLLTIVWKGLKLYKRKLTTTVQQGSDNFWSKSELPCTSRREIHIHEAHPSEVHELGGS